MALLTQGGGGAFFSRSPPEQHLPDEVGRLPRPAPERGDALRRVRPREALGLRENGEVALQPELLLQEGLRGRARAEESEPRLFLSRARAEEATPFQSHALVRSAQVGAGSYVSQDFSRGGGSPPPARRGRPSPAPGRRRPGPSPRGPRPGEGRRRRRGPCRPGAAAPRRAPTTPAASRPPWGAGGTACEGALVLFPFL